MGRKALTAAVLLTAAMLSAGACAQQAYTTVEALQESTPARWQETYETVRGETVNVDCPVTVPQVSAAPVLRAVWYPMLDEAAAEYAPPSAEAAYRYMFSMRPQSHSMVMIHDFHNMDAPGEDPLKNLFRTQYVPLEALNWDEALCYGSELTAREAFDAISADIGAIFETYGAYGYYPAEPAYGVYVRQMTDKEGTPKRDTGYYGFSGFETMRGIPILGCVGASFAQINMYPHECIPEVRYYVLNAEGPGQYGMAAKLLAEEAVLCADVPLVGFEDVKPQFEALIEDGRVRRVFGVRLGYMIYFEADHSMERFCLAPTWVMACEYYDSAQTPTAQQEEDAPEYLRLDYSIGQQFRLICANAQTGKLIDPADESSTRSDAPRMLTWDEVGQ